MSDAEFVDLNPTDTSGAFSVVEPVHDTKLEVEIRDSGGKARTSFTTEEEVYLYVKLTDAVNGSVLPNLPVDSELQTGVEEVLLGFRDWTLSDGIVRRKLGALPKGGYIVIVSFGGFVETMEEGTLYYGPARVEMLVR